MNRTNLHQDAFKNTVGLRLEKSFNLPLELVVQVYNINHGRNPQIFAKSKTLGNYSIFIEKINEYNDEPRRRATRYRRSARYGFYAGFNTTAYKAMPSSEPPQSGGVLNPPANKKLTLEESVKTAIKYCIENNVLKQFLKEHGSEVFNMLTEEPSIEEIINIRVEEAVEDALEEAVQRVVKEAVNEAVKEAVEEGLEKGLEKGRAEIFNLLDQGLSVEEIKQRLSYSPA